MIPVSKRCPKGDGENIASSSFHDLLVFVFITFGHRLRNYRNSQVKIDKALMEEGTRGG